VILFTCSATSPAVDQVRPLFDIPILKIDDAMSARAVAAGERIGLLCTNHSTAVPSESLLREHAARQKRRVEVVAVVEDAAFAAVRAGDRDTHDRLVSTAAARLARDCDTIVLAQASMAHLAPLIAGKTGLPVLTSPEPCVEALADVLGA
jgi:Asp/Glu/hydantoin racemase